MNHKEVNNFSEEEMLNMSPWDFDQSSNGWRIFEKTKEYIKAAKLIRLYITKNKDWILNPKAGEKEIEIRVMYFHIGQLLASAGQEHYEEAIEVFPMALEDGHECWNAYVFGTIGFLEGDMEKIDNAISTIENSEEYKQDKRSGNPQVVISLKKALERGERDYEKAYASQ